MAKRLGVTQQTYSAAERNAANMSVVKLMSPP
jgi:DNA-binding XRE family transcriptional regulator